MNRVILLDLDGVMCRFVDGVLKLFNMEYPKTWPKGVYDFCTAIGISNSEMWAKVDAEGSRFWSELEEYEWARDLYDGCCRLAPTFFCTSPSYAPSSLSGKLEWMQKFTGKRSFRNYVVTPQKHLLAKDGAILIDDYDENVRKFLNADPLADAILFPQDWNHGFHNHPYNDKLTWVLEELEGLFESDQRGIF